MSIKRDPVTGRIMKGNIPWNKGVKGLQLRGRAKYTQFKKGNSPANHRPVGSTRLCSKDGYVLIKVAEGMFKWRLLHRENWKKHYGEYPPKGTAIQFIDGNKENCDISNLKLVTRRELMQQNSVHNLPEELKDVIRLKGVLRRKINGK